MVCTSFQYSSCYKSHNSTIRWKSLVSWCWWLSDIGFLLTFRYEYKINIVVSSFYCMHWGIDITVKSSTCKGHVFAKIFEATLLISSLADVFSKIFSVMVISFHNTWTIEKLPCSMRGQKMNHILSGRHLKSLCKNFSTWVRMLLSWTWILLILVKKFG